MFLSLKEKKSSPEISNERKWLPKRKARKSGCGSRDILCSSVPESNEKSRSITEINEQCRSQHYPPFLPLIVLLLHRPPSIQFFSPCKFFFLLSLVSLSVSFFFTSITRMLTRILSNAGGAVRNHLRRNIYISAPALQQAAALDPIQQLFVNKIRDYANKSKAAGGELVDATPDVKKSLEDELAKVSRAHNAVGKDMTSFPAFTWANPTLEPVSVKSEGGSAAAQTQTAAVEEADEDISSTPYFDI